MEIRLHFPVFGQSGYEVLCRGIAIALDKLGVKVELREQLWWNLERTGLEIEIISRLMRIRNQVVKENAPEIYQQVPNEEDLQKSKAQKKYCISLFETDRCPEPWLKNFVKLNGLWVFSKFNKELWERNNGVEGIKVISFAIDTDSFNPDVEPAKIKNKKKFVFMTTGDLLERKNIDGLIKAFVKEFRGKEDVCLIVKVHHLGFQKIFQRDCLIRLKKMALEVKIEDYPTILFFGDNIPREALPSFYKVADCFVLASKGEGLGLPYAEALACEVPVIASNWGGQLEFLNDTNAYFVDTRVEIIDDIEYIKKCPHALNHRWAISDEGSLRKQMRYVYNNYAEAKEKAKKGRLDLLKRSWQDTGLWIINEIFGDKK